MQRAEAGQVTDSIQVTVKLFATFRVGRFAMATRSYPAGTVIADVIGSLRIPEAQIGIIMVNHLHAELDHPLADGDDLALFPLVGGG